jgi:hypothetical protein
MSEEVEQVELEEIDLGSRKMPGFVKKGLVAVQGGQYYLRAAYRILWMREERGDSWTIQTQVFYFDPEKQFVIFKATILDETGRVIATAHHEEKAGKLPFIRKAETGAVARVLGMCGYGTQFGDMDEDADGTIENTADGAHGSNPKGAQAATPAVNTGTKNCPSCGAPAGKPHASKCDVVHKDASQSRQDDHTASKDEPMATPSQTERLAQIYFDLGITVDWDSEKGMSAKEYRERAHAVAPEYEAYKIRKRNETPAQRAERNELK